MSGKILGQVFDFLNTVKPSDGEKFLMTIGGFIGGIFTFAVGGIDDAITWLIILTIIDYVTGTTASFREGRWCSERGFCGLFKKLFIFLVVAICNGIDKATGQEILRNVAVFAYAVNEAGSILENIDRLGLEKWIPKFLRVGIQALRKSAAEINSEEKLKSIDGRSIRSIRSILTGKATEADKERLKSLCDKCDDIRAEIEKERKEKNHDENNLH